MFNKFTGLNNGLHKVCISLLAEYFYIFTIKRKMNIKKKKCLKDTYCTSNRQFNSSEI